MWSGPTVQAAAPSGAAPSIVSVLVPTPWMLAPRSDRKRARSWTCGSQAALRSVVLPRAATAAIRAFSVAVTLVSSRKISAPARVFASSW